MARIVAPNARQYLAEFGTIQTISLEPATLMPGRQGSLALVALVLACAACATRGAERVVDDASLAPALTPPRSLGRYVLRESRVVAPPGRGTFHRYSSHSGDSTARLSVFIYPAFREQLAGGPRAAAMLEGPLFFEALKVRAQRGLYDDYSVAFSDPDTVQVDGQTLYGNASGATTTSQGRVTVELQYLYVLNATFVKVRGTVPAGGWERTDVPVFARELVSLLAHQARRASAPDTGRLVVAAYRAMRLEEQKRAAAPLNLDESSFDKEKYRLLSLMEVPDGFIIEIERRGPPEYLAVIRLTRAGRVRSVVLSP